MVTKGTRINEDGFQTGEIMMTLFPEYRERGLGTDEKAHLVVDFCEGSAGFEVLLLHEDARISRKARQQVCGDVPPSRETAVEEPFFFFAERPCEALAAGSLPSRPFYQQRSNRCREDYHRADLKSNHPAGRGHFSTVEGTCAKLEGAVSVVQDADKISGGKEDEPVFILIHREGTARGQLHAGRIAVVCAGGGIFFPDPLGDAPGGAFKAAADVVFALESRFHDLKLERADRAEEGHTLGAAVHVVGLGDTLFEELLHAGAVAV